MNKIQPMIQQTNYQEASQPVQVPVVINNQLFIVTYQCIRNTLDTNLLNFQQFVGNLPDNGLIQQSIPMLLNMNGINLLAYPINTCNSIVQTLPNTQINHVQNLLDMEWQTSKQQENKVIDYSAQNMNRDYLDRLRNESIMPKKRVRFQEDDTEPRKRRNLSILIDVDMCKDEKSMTSSPTAFDLIRQRKQSENLFF